MSSKIVFLGTSDFSLAMMMEIVDDQYEHPVVTAVQNTNHSLIHPYETKTTSVRLIESDRWEKDSSSLIFLGVNKPNTKLAVFEYFRHNFQINLHEYQSLIHSSSVIASTVEKTPGLVIHPLTVVSAHTRLDEMVSINRGVTVGHHTSIGAFSTIHPGANVAGNCDIEKGVILGMGCNVIDGIKIGAGSVIGAGSTVVKNIPSGVIALGQPAKITREIDNPFNS